MKNAADIIVQAFDTLELFFRGVSKPSLPFHRDSSRKTKKYPSDFTSADQEIKKTYRHESDPSKQGNPARSVSLLGPGGRVFLPVGGGIVRNHLELLAAYTHDAISGYGPKHDFRETPKDHDIDKGLEDTKQLFGTKNLMWDNPEAIANIKEWDCVLFILDPVYRSETSSTQCLLEAVFLRDVYYQYYGITLPVYSISLMEGICKRIEVTDELIILSFLKLYQELLNNQILSLETDDIDTWLTHGIQNPLAVVLDTHYSQDLKIAVRERLKAYRLRGLKVSIKNDLNRLNFNGLIHLSEKSEYLNSLIKTCAKDWIEKDLSKINNLMRSDEIYQIIHTFSPNAEIDLKASFLRILKQSVKHFIENNFVDTFMLDIQELSQLMINKGYIKLGKYYTSIFHEGLINILQNDNTFKIETIIRKFLEDFHFNDSKKIDYHIDILKIMIFNNYYQPKAANVFVAIFEDLLLNPQGSEKRNNFLMSILSNENVPIYQSLLMDTFSDWCETKNIKNASDFNSRTLKKLVGLVEQDKKIRPKFQ